MLSLQLCFWAHFFGQLDGHSRKFGLEFSSSTVSTDSTDSMFPVIIMCVIVSGDYYVHYCFQ